MANRAEAALVCILAIYKKGWIQVEQRQRLTKRRTFMKRKQGEDNGWVVVPGETRRCQAWE